MQKSLHIFLILATCVFLSACKKEPLPDIYAINETPYYPDLKVSNEWNSESLGSPDYEFIFADSEVVIVSNDASIKAFNSEDGSLLWNYEIAPFESSLHLKYHYYDGNVYIMHYDDNSNSISETTNGNITTINVTTGIETKQIEYESVNPELEQVINIYPYQDNVLIFSNFDDENDENVLNIYNLNLQTNEISIISENFKTLHHLDIKNSVVDTKDGIFIFPVLQMENQMINTYLNIIDLNNYSIKSILVENYHFNFHSYVYYSKGIAIIATSQTDNFALAVDINTGENLWKDKAPDFMLTHLERDFGFEEGFGPGLVHHDRTNNYYRIYPLNYSINPTLVQFHPEKYIFMDITDKYDTDSGNTYDYISLFDLNDGKMLISTRLDISATKLHIGLEPEKIYTISDSRIYQFSHPL